MRLSKDSSRPVRLIARDDRGGRGSTRSITVYDTTPEAVIQLFERVINLEERGEIPSVDAGRGVSAVSSPDSGDVSSCDVDGCRNSARQSQRKAATV